MGYRSRYWSRYICFRGQGFSGPSGFPPGTIRVGFDYLSVFAWPAWTLWTWQFQRIDRNKWYLLFGFCGVRMNIYWRQLV